ncbi:MAG: 50S ribosomal protein L4 [Candidatus Shikimatogenerans sp. JK-2022]|nr:50S ribosomal protein L4 [Candidatus Shikimatogenerans bostrichidophilus]
MYIKNKLIKENLKKIKFYNKIKNKNHIIYLYIKSYLKSKRLGNSKTKERSEIKGSTRKILKQKGTGNSRKGDIKNPIFKGGGRVFGPKKRNYKIKINKNVKILAKKIILSKKIIENKVIIIKKLILKSFKTKNIINFFNKKKIDIKKKNLIIIQEENKNLFFSTKNLKNIKINNFLNINYFQVLYSDYIILIGKDIEKLIVDFLNK